MGLFSGWQSMAASAAQIVANLAGQTVSMLKLTLTQVSGEVALQMTDGARLKLGAGTTDYLTSNGSTKLTAAGDFDVVGTLNAANSSLVVNGVSGAVTLGNGSSFVVGYTDSSGTPGNATINRLSGRSAIALGASSCVVTNSFVAATSRVFMMTRTRDATGLLPLVTTVGAGSFTVSTSANCAANLVFDWFVIN